MQSKKTLKFKRQEKVVNYLLSKIYFKPLFSKCHSWYSAYKIKKCSNEPCWKMQNKIMKTTTTWNLMINQLQINFKTGFNRLYFDFLMYDDIGKSLYSKSHTWDRLGRPGTKEEETLKVICTQDLKGSFIQICVECVQSCI